MNSEPILRQSLQEIAHLLLMIYEKYKFLNVTQLDCLTSLCEFLRDAGLEDRICVLDVEYFRRKVALPEANNLVSMGYEKFYQWLKEVSASYYQYDSISKNNKKSFHKLLVDYIVPFSSSRDIDGMRARSLSTTTLWLQNMDSRSLETLVESRDLLKLWFLSILSQVRSM
jgi:hypothetical protein